MWSAGFSTPPWRAPYSHETVIKILVRLEFELKLEPLLLTSPAAATAAPAAALF